MPISRRRLLSAWACVPAMSAAHDFKAGSITLDHPYVVLARPGSTQASLHFLGLRNAGGRADRLLSASSPDVAGIEFHHGPPNGDMHRLEAIDLPAGQTVSLRHDGHLHIMLNGLTRALKDGDGLRITLRFQHAGEHSLVAHVQTPRARTRPAAEHKH